MYFLEKTIIDIFNIEKLPKNFDKDSSIFFDIETSGLSPKSSFVFLIGILFFKGSKLILRQYFAENADDEVNILKNFIEDVSHFKNIYNYNGTSFDFPYVIERFKKHSIDFSFDSHNNIDIYKILLSYKDNINFKSYKLKNIEKSLNIIRADELSGIEVVEHYKNYCNCRNAMQRDKILLHNEEDIVNMYRILPIIAITEGIGSHDAPSVSELYISINDSSVLVNGIGTFKTDKINVKTNEYSFSYNNNKEFSIEFKISEGLLYYQFKDYKNYYYLPQEDMAIHKSLYKYNKNLKKVPATKNNCYSKLTTKYIILPFIPSTDDFKICTTDPLLQSNCVIVNELAGKLTNDSTIIFFKKLIEIMINFKKLQ